MTTGGLCLGGVRKSFGGAPILRDIDLVVETGRLLALLGPSGCGKTTVLRSIAGFEPIDAGSIALDGRVLSGPRGCIPPHQRGIGIVPQDGALFPHMSVADNVGFGLRTGRSDRVRDLLALVGLTGFDRRFPHQLSGGQQQRVALARALAPRPRLVLLDEPFNALDAGLRRELCADVRRILKDSGSTAILVSHDRDDAFAMADKLAVMREGRIVQSGTPREVYDEPLDLETADLCGSVVCLPGLIDGDTVDTCLGRLAVGNPQAFDPLGPVARQVAAMVRPEQIVPTGTGAGRLVTIEDKNFLGPLTGVRLVVPDAGRDTEISACWPTELAYGCGREVRVSVRGSARVFPAEPA